MTQQERIDLYEKAIGAWGVPNQVMMVMEESGEMLNALAKFNRGRSTEDEIVTELADVWILMEQMAVVFGWDKFQQQKEYKLQRLQERITNFVEIPDEYFPKGLIDAVNNHGRIDPQNGSQRYVTSIAVHGRQDG